MHNIFIDIVALKVVLVLVSQYFSVQIINN